MRSTKTVCEAQTLSLEANSQVSQETTRHEVGGWERGKLRQAREILMEGERDGQMSSKVQRWTLYHIGGA